MTITGVFRKFALGGKTENWGYNCKILSQNNRPGGYSENRWAVFGNGSTHLSMKKIPLNAIH